MVQIEPEILHKTEVNSVGIICICNSMIWSAIWELIARVRFVISRGEAE